MSKVIQNKGGIGMGAPYDIPGYEYDPVTDKFKDLATGNTFDKDGNAKLEDSKSVSITDNGTYEIKPSATYDAMKKVALSVEVQAADLEDNKAATIDVSTYTEPVEVTPTQGKDGMKKVTVSLSNIPAGANMLYAWKFSTSPSAGYIIYTPYSTAPADLAEFESLPTMGTNQSIIEGVTTDFISIIDTQDAFSYTKVSDTKFSVVWSEGGSEIILTRDPTSDLEVWNAPPEVETTKQATIDVSTYDPANKPVITPTAGKQSMGSVEVTLSNIPSGGATLYAWAVNGGSLYLNIGVAPSTADVSDIKFLAGSLDLMTLDAMDLMMLGNIYTYISDTEFTITHSGTTDTYTRGDPTYDTTLW